MFPLPARRPSQIFASPLLGVLVTLLALGSFLSRPVQANDTTTVAVLKRVEAKSRAVASRVLGATVGIINHSLASSDRLGEGSGVVVSEDGLILTAGHVIAQPGCDLTVIFPDGRRAAAKGLGANFARDSGLARFTMAGKWPHVEMARSNDIKPGTWCVALGHPGGIQQGRTPPIRLGRVLNSGKDARFLVTDATVISGDSGGPLFDLDGRVIGIHSNIGANFDQNRHVPIDVFREQWNDLLAGKAIGNPADLHITNTPDPEKLKRFRKLFLQRLMAGDPEVRDLFKDGRFNLMPGDIDRLIAKWEKPPASDVAPAPASDAAARPLDFLKFQRLFKERLAARDSEVLGLIKNGTMMVTPEQMHELMDKWENKPRIAPENASYLPDLLSALRAADIASLATDYGKSSPALLRDVAPIAAPAGRSTVQILCDGRPAAWGTVVRNDGYIVTKSSELHGKLACTIGARELPANLVKSNAQQDLALLKVDANDLMPINWAGGDPPVAGSWLITPAPGKDALGLGVVSVAARAIANAPKILLRDRAVVGVILDPMAKVALVHGVAPNLPAAKAGLRPGDVILNVDGQPTPTFREVNQTIGKYNVGDIVTMEITRDSKPMKLKVDLVSSDQMAPKMNGDRLTHLSEAGGTVSKRHTGFPIALTHDTVLQAAQCGGPVVDLDGRAIGLNIARADRTASYAIPAATVRAVVADLLAGVK
ncbi:MAG: trypsin-like peptidase domain-containing protein [Thermoguttaceae bacterium]